MDESEFVELQSTVEVGVHELMWTDSAARAASDREDVRAYCSCGWVCAMPAIASTQRVAFVDHLTQLMDQ